MLSGLLVSPLVAGFDTTCIKLILNVMSLLVSHLVAVFGTSNKNFNIYHVSVTPAVNFRAIYLKVNNNYF
jgi:hypothetical protein